MSTKKQSKAVVMGIDPSYRNLAISTLYKNRTIVMETYQTTLGDRIDFTKSYQVANEITDLVATELSNRNKDIELIISEIPAPNMQFSSGLSILDSLLMYKLSVVLNPKKVYTLSPSFLSHLHGTNKYTKKDSLTLCKHFISVLEENNYKIIYNGKLNADMAEAFLFMLKGIILLGKYENLQTIILNELNTFEGEFYKILLGE